MIITRSPFRISFFGGSTDYESFYSKHGSLLIGTTIDQYMYIGMRHRHAICGNESTFTYSKLERVKNNKDIEHPVLRHVFANYPKPVSMNLFTDVPARTGLGGSSTFTVGLLHAVHRLINQEVTRRELADSAIRIERYHLKEAGGVQDQIWAAYGGLNSIYIDMKGHFSVRPLPVSCEFKNLLQKSMILVYTNSTRAPKVADSHEGGLNYKMRIKETAEEAYRLFEGEYLEDIGRLMYESWLLKKQISPLISTPVVEETTEIMMEEEGCFGVKLLGSGGNGFVLGICDPDSNAKENIKNRFPSRALEVGLDTEGVKAIV